MAAIYCRGLCRCPVSLDPSSVAPEVSVQSHRSRIQTAARRCLGRLNPGPSAPASPSQDAALCMKDWHRSHARLHLLLKVVVIDHAKVIYHI